MPMMFVSIERAALVGSDGAALVGSDRAALVQSDGAALVSETPRVAERPTQAQGFDRATARFALRQRTTPVAGWHSHSRPLQTVRVNDASPPSAPAVQDAGPPQPKRRWGLLALATLVVAGAAFAGSALTTLAFQLFAGRAQPTTTTELRGTGAVVSAIRDLATLESASYHMERVIDLKDRQSHMFGLFESQDAILLVASADVVAGIDLQSMRDGDITVDDVHHSAQVTLPPPIILSSRLDNENTYVHSRKTDQLAVPAQGLETRARQAAEQSLREAALEAGILERARGNASVTIKTLLHSLGFEPVQVTFRAE